MFNIKDVMSENVFSVSPQASIEEAVEVMKKNNVSCVIVIDQKRAKGIVTERDVTQKCVANKISVKQPVTDIMSAPLYITTKEKDAVEIASVMRQVNIKKIPVMHEGELVGIVTDTDLLKGFLDKVAELEKEKNMVPDYNKRTRDFIENINTGFKSVKIWHMVCHVCKNKFYNEERNGIMGQDRCPYCGSTDFDHIK